MEIFEKVVDVLKLNSLYVATMESCTGGAIAAEITNHPGASQILKFSAVTYSNEFKIKMGVNPDIIDTYSVYSMEVAVEMARNISLFTESNYGIGITGKINDPDPNNDFSNDDDIFISIYDRSNDLDYCFNIKALNVSREENKSYIVNYIGEQFYNILAREYGLQEDIKKKELTL